MKLFVDPLTFKQISDNLVKDVGERTPIYYAIKGGELHLAMVQKNVEWYSISSEDIANTTEMQELLTKENAFQVLKIAETYRG